MRNGMNKEEVRIAWLRVPGLVKLDPNLKDTARVSSSWTVEAILEWPLKPIVVHVNMIGAVVQRHRRG